MRSAPCATGSGAGFAGSCQGRPRSASAGVRGTSRRAKWPPPRGAAGCCAPAGAASAERRRTAGARGRWAERPDRRRVAPPCSALLAGREGGTMALSAEDREHWTRHGWTWLRGFLSARETADVARWTDEIAGWPETPGRWMRYYERAPDGRKMLARIENFLPYHEGMASLFAGPRLFDLLADCCGEPVVLFKDKINFKLPGGAGFADHQDAPAYVDFGVRDHLTVMVPVDPFT